VGLTISHRGSRDEVRDSAGPAAAAALRDGMGANVIATEVIPAEKDQIARRLKHHGDGQSIDLVLTPGGTGLASRDVTPEATREVLHRLAPGLDEAMRRESSKMSPTALLGRGVSGIRHATLVVNLPGTERSATENLGTILRALPHGLAKLRGDPSDGGRPEESR
jgi:molybdenum cofactor synthesis domain-containing protein